jgi:hypothetical protein
LPEVAARRKISPTARTVKRTTTHRTSPPKCDALRFQPLAVEALPTLPPLFAAGAGAGAGDDDWALLVAPWLPPCWLSAGGAGAGAGDEDWACICWEPVLLSDAPPSSAGAGAGDVVAVDLVVVAGMPKDGTAVPSTKVHETSRMPSSRLPIAEKAPVER